MNAQAQTIGLYVLPQPRFVVVDCTACYGSGSLKFRTCGECSGRGILAQEAKTGIERNIDQMVIAFNGGHITRQELDSLTV